MITDCLHHLNSTCCPFIQTIQPTNQLKIFKPHQITNKKINHQTFSHQLISSKKSIKHQINIKNNKKNRQSKKYITTQNTQINTPFKKIKDNYDGDLTSSPQSPKKISYQVKTLPHSPRSLETLMSTRQMRYSPPLNITFSYHNLNNLSNNPQETNPLQIKNLHQYIEKLPMHRLNERERGSCSPRTVISVLVDSEKQSIVDRSYCQY